MVSGAVKGTVKGIFTLPKDIIENTSKFLTNEKQ